MISPNPKSKNGCRSLHRKSADAAAFSSKAVHEGAAGAKMLAIYRAVSTDGYYTDGQWKVLDKAQLFCAILILSNEGMIERSLQ